MSNPIKEGKLVYNSQMIDHRDNEIREHNCTYEIEIRTHDIYVYNDIIKTLERINSGKDILFVDEFLKEYDMLKQRVKKLEELVQ